MKAYPPLKYKRVEWRCQIAIPLPVSTQKFGLSLPPTLITIEIYESRKIERGIIGHSFVTCFFKYQVATP